MSAPPAFQSLPEPLPADPLPLLASWLADAANALGEDHPNATAMTLATATADGAPDARLVLCRGVDAVRGVLTFYTDRSSRKGQQLAENPRAAGVFYWEPLYRQLRIRGPILPTGDEDSDAYFAGRPFESQVSAFASRQSTPLATRSEIERSHAQLALQMQKAGFVPRPARWGGYRLWIEELELWVGRSDRLHDRARFTRKLERAGAEYAASPWNVTRIQP